MPTLETPPNPALPPTDRETPSNEAAPLKVRTGRFGELDHTELVHLLDSLDDDRARSRFREAIYISVLFYVALAWFVFYGPRVLFHTPRLVPAEAKQHSNELAYLDMPKELIKRPPPKTAKAISDQNTIAQTKHPTPDQKTPEQLEAMRQAGREGAPTPLPQAPKPQPQAAPQQAQPTPQQPTPPQPQQQARQPVNSAIPDAPRPSASTRPNFNTQQNPGRSIADAANAAARTRGQGGYEGANAPLAHQGAQSGVEVLSDTMGVDFGPYLRRLHTLIYNAWVPLLPEETEPPLLKSGTTVIRITIQPNGTLSFMHLDGSTHDIAIDKAAWGSITSQGQLPPLPPAFKGQDLQLRYTFMVNPKDHSMAQ